MAAVEGGIVSFYDGFDAGFKLYGVLVEDLFGTEGRCKERNVYLLANRRYIWWRIIVTVLWNDCEREAGRIRFIM